MADEQWDSMPPVIDTFARRTTWGRLTGIPLALQSGLLFLHWWWVFVLWYPGSLIRMNSQYAGFALIGDDDYWLHRAIAVSILATFSVFPMPRVFCELIVGVQAAWLIILTVLYLRVWPPTTGPGAYLVLAWIAAILAYLRWRSGDAER